MSRNCQKFKFDLSILLLVFDWSMNINLWRTKNHRFSWAFTFYPWIRFAPYTFSSFSPLTEGENPSDSLIKSEKLLLTLDRLKSRSTDKFAFSWADGFADLDSKGIFAFFEFPFFQIAWCLVFRLNSWIFSIISFIFSISLFPIVKISLKRTSRSPRASSWISCPHFPPSWAMLNILISDSYFNGFYLFLMIFMLSLLSALRIFLVSP